MIDHMTFRVTDIEKSLYFYTQALAPLGYSPAVDMVHKDVRIVGLASEGKIDTWLIHADSASNHTHLAWRAKNRAEVDAFYAYAIAAGGKSNGAPGLRTHYHADYYGAFVLDPDGNNVEAVCHNPE